MQTQPAHDQLDRHPTWIVQTVFDPEGGGKDFAYTIGLDALGHAELHLWGRPNLGDDPGDDWMFSPSDRCRILNELAWLLIDGELEIGTELTREYDDGEAVVRFRVDPPGDIEELEAFGVPAGASVLPVRWSLTRPPEGPPRALSKDAGQQARSVRRQILATIDRRRWAPAGWSLDGRASYTCKQRFGPLTPVVLARAAQLWQADVTAWNYLMRAASDVAHASSLTYPVTAAAAVARRVGRRKALAHLEDAVVELVDQLTEDPRWARHWRELELSLWGTEIVDDAELAWRAHRSDKALLLEVTTACLVAEAVADVIEPRHLVHARGPWLTSLGPSTDLPGRHWCAPADVLDVVMRLLEPISALELAELTERHLAAMAGAGPEGGDYQEVFSRVHGWALAGPAGCPWVGRLGTLPAWRTAWGTLLTAETAIEVQPVPVLQEWASGVTSAICHRGRLSADDVRVLAAPCVDVLPDLERVLNEPVVGRPQECA
jgi:hypothetical protein